MVSGEAKVTVIEHVTNMSPQDLEFSWLIHPAFSEPFLAPGCTVMVPAETIVAGPEEWAKYGRLRPGRTRWPNAVGRNGDSVNLSVIPERNLIAEETIFITDLHEGRYMLVNNKLGYGFSMEWDKHVFPWLWFWQNLNQPDYPYYGRAWNVAIEPCTSYPSGLEEQVKGGTAHVIKGKSALKTTYSASIVPVRP